MEEKPTSVEEKILIVTIECIEKYGLSGATNRRIAEMAGVNLAAINYYFRSKDALLQRVMEITLKNAFDLSDIPPMPGADPVERCTAIFTDLLQGSFHYPGITRAHFHNLLVEGEYDALLVARVNRFIADLAADLGTRGCALPPAELTTALQQLFSAVMFPALAPQLFEPPGGDWKNAEKMQAYVRRLVQKLLGNSLKNS
jgi:AcrR family transcriptional regulator